MQWPFSNTPNLEGKPLPVFGNVNIGKWLLKLQILMESQVVVEDLFN